jgi:Integrase core domain
MSMNRYLVAVMDWFSRFVLSWSLSLTMEVDSCVEALRRALRRGRPEILNTDQGSEFTSGKFTGELAERQVAISMDGRGRRPQNSTPRPRRTLACCGQKMIFTMGSTMNSMELRAYTSQSGSPQRWYHVHST